MSATEGDAAGNEAQHFNLHTWLETNFSSPSPQEDKTEVMKLIQLEPNTWQEIRLFLSSSFVDTHAERDVIIKRVIPSLNRRLAPMFVRITAVDLRWGVLSEESKDCNAIQKTCLNQVENCKLLGDQTPWFLGLRTQRYGWVQTEYQGSDGFNHPEQFHWLDEFAKIEKHVSITSLECLHAGVPPARETAKPTVFFYQRNITNESEIEPHLRWVFDYEYVPEDQELADEVKFQYTKTKFAQSYEDDRNNLDLFLQNADHITYRKYDCVYEAGGAMITGGGGGRKMFGVGYVTGLEAFEKQMEDDLYEAVISNFKAADLSSIKPHELENIPYENAVKEKALNFVGRTELVQKCFSFCLRDVKDIEDEGNVMIIHGEPGCGKSALTAALSMKFVEKVRSRGQFVFIHAVDTCPNSNSITSMIKRLHVNLREFSQNNSQDKEGQDENDACLESPSDLKRNHVQLLNEAARRHPDRYFVLLVDAVNQFNPALQAHLMWWLPARPPKNLRIIVSTLTEENDTFANACKVCPGAHQVHVESMTHEDGEQMVTEILGKFNKKLTTTDHGFLGNQMQKLLEKNLSPLYLTAATQALRTFGIFEKLTPYIESLPNTIAELFKFLLNGWKEEYGSNFVRDVFGILYLSKDGILENTVNDILSFIEKAEGSEYECSFSRIYESLKGFLAAGGGGHLRLFHDQLNKVVAGELVNSQDEQRLHGLIAEFYLTQILPQLCEYPAELPPAYYTDCVTRVVHHKMNSMEVTKESKGVFKHTLRDIYFVRERVKLGQEDLLLQEYVIAIQLFKHTEELKALKDWKKFVLNYIPYMQKYPESTYNMGIQQYQNSNVVIDSQRYSPCASQYGLAPVLKNVPLADDAIVFKYKYSMKCNGCFATDADTNLMASSGSGKSFLYEADSGVLLHEFASDGCGAVFISTYSQTLWAGSGEGIVSVWSISNGDAVWKEDVGIGTQKTHLGREVKDSVRWIGKVGQVNMATCSSKGLITILEDGWVCSKIKSWNTQQSEEFKYEETYCCSYQESTELIATGHYELVKFWDTEGTLVRSVTVKSDGACQRLSFSPINDDMLVGFHHYKEEDYNSNLYRSLQCVKSTTGENVFSLMDVWGLVAQYHPLGDVFVTLTKDMKTPLVYGSDGKLRHKLDGHDDLVRDVCFVPGRDELVTAAWDGSVLFTVPTGAGNAVMDDKDLWKDDGEVVMCCGMLHTGEEFFTLSEWSELRVWNVASSQCVASMKKEKIKHSSPRKGSAVAHPSQKCILVVSTRDLYLINAIDCKILSQVKVGTSPNSREITDLKVSPHGDKCVVCSYDNCYVFHITSKNAIKRSIGGGVSQMFRSKENQVTYEKNGGMAKCDVNSDGSMVVNGGSKGIFLWDINTGKGIKTLKEMEDVKNVKFLYNLSEQVMYSAGSDRKGYAVGILDMEGTLVRAFENASNFSLFANHDRFIECGEVLRIYDIATGDVIYTFVHHRAKNFTCFLELNNTILAYNKNETKYVLEYVNE